MFRYSYWQSLCGTAVIFVVAVLAFDFASPQQVESIASQIASQYRTTAIFIAVKGITSQGREEAKSASGFVISPEGYVVTAAHLFDSSNGDPFAKWTTTGSLGTSFDIGSPTGVIWPLQLVRKNTDVDGALLKLPLIPDQKYNSVHFCQGVSVKTGDPLYALGYPNAQPLTVNSGTLSSKDAPNGLWKTDALVAAGSSGGPVFDGTGHVVGLVKGGIKESPGSNFIVPINLAIDILQSGLASIDDCSGKAQLRADVDCSSQTITYPIDFQKTDHPSFNTDNRPFIKTFSALPNHSIETYQWFPLEQSKATPPLISVPNDKTSLHFESTVSSGSFSDPWNGRIRGTIVTTQKPKCN
jgi:S1-C subfamily serine protease